METKCSLAFSQQPATCPSAEQEKSNPGTLIHFFKKHFNITLKVTPSYSKGFFPSTSSPQTFLLFSHVPHTPPIDFIIMSVLQPGCAAFNIPCCASPLHFFAALAFQFLTQRPTRMH